MISKYVQARRPHTLSCAMFRVTRSIPVLFVIDRNVKLDLLGQTLPKTHFAVFTPGHDPAKKEDMYPLRAGISYRTSVHASVSCETSLGGTREWQSRLLDDGSKIRTLSIGLRRADTHGVAASVTARPRC